MKKASNLQLKQLNIFEIYEERFYTLKRLLLLRKILFIQLQIKNLWSYEHNFVSYSGRPAP